MTHPSRVTAPLMLRCPQAGPAPGGERVLLQCWPHPRGLVVLEPPISAVDLDRAVSVIAGELRGEGPWRLGDCVLQVLGCQGSNAALAGAYASWTEAVAEGRIELPGRDAVRARVAALGGQLSD